MTTLERPKIRTKTPVTDDPRWERIGARDRSADGLFWYSVMTTRVYCRPSCPSRAANPENVQLHDTIEAARATGFRPCKRCKPDGLSVDAEIAAIVAKTCRLIEKSEEEPSLIQLATAAGLSPSHFHRLFKATTGLTPKDYAAAHRAARVRDGLSSGNSVTEAIYNAGFNSSGRFYEKSTNMLGMTPTRYRSGGTDEEIRFAVGESSLGTFLVASSRKGVAAILIGSDPDELVRSLQDRFPKARLIGADAEYKALVARVVGLIDAPRQGLGLPLDIRGTAFQQSMAGLARNPGGAHGVVRRDRSSDRLAEGGSGRRRRLCGQQFGCGCPMPPGCSDRRLIVWVRLGRGPEAFASRPGKDRDRTLTSNVLKHLPTKACLRT